MTLAFVFPGQGSQSIGMLDALAAEFPPAAETFTQASQVLGYDLWDIVAHGPEERLNQTQVTQPAMLTAGVAIWRIWLAQGGSRPAVMAGHSLGEYTALVCAGALDFSDAIGFVVDRSRFMQEAVPVGQGAMAAIVGLDDDAVRRLCKQAAQGEVLEPVNFNSSNQVVIAGTTAAVQRALAQAKEAGAKRAVALSVSVPAHCRLMHPATEKMAFRLKQLKLAIPQIPVIHNVHVKSENNPDAMRELLARHIESPVRWVETIRQMTAQGVTRIVECGPGRVLTGLNRRMSGAAETRAVFDPTSLRDALPWAAQA